VKRRHGTSIGCPWGSRSCLWFDRKSPRVDARFLGEALVALANADGGVLVIGIHNGEVNGIDGQGSGKQNDWRQAAMNFTEPPVRHRFEYDANDRFTYLTYLGGPRSRWPSSRST